MACTLYEAAFSVMAAIYRTEYKRAVTTVTLAGGFASTVFWPLTERLVAWIGWREAAFVYVVLHLAICLPLHRFGLPVAGPSETGIARRTGVGSHFAQLIRLRAFWLLAGSYMFNAVVFSVVSVHLVPLFQSRGFTPRDAAWIERAQDRCRCSVALSSSNSDIAGLRRKRGLLLSRWCCRH